MAAFIKGNVQVPLDAGIDIPGGFAMADGDDAGGLLHGVEHAQAA
jgi:hypothetical protein